MKNCWLKFFVKNMDVPLASFFDKFVPIKDSFLAFQWVSIKSKKKMKFSDCNSQFDYLSDVLAYTISITKNRKDLRR